MEKVIELSKQIFKCRKCSEAASLPLPMFVTPQFKGIVFCGRNPGVAKAEHGEYSNETHTKEFPYEEWIKRYESGLKNSNVGKFYIQILNKIGLSFDQIAITNICKCVFANNRELKDEEICNCLPWLKEQLYLLHPKKVVVFGGQSKKTLIEEKLPYNILYSKHPSYYEVYATTEKERAINEICEFLQTQESQRKLGDEI